MIDMRWCDFGMDGFRIDAISHIPDQFVDIKKEMRNTL